MRSLVVSLGSVVLAGAFYLLLIDTTSPPELYGLAGVALLAALAFVAAREPRTADAALAARCLRQGWRPLARIPKQVIVLCREALAQLVRPRPHRGAFTAVPFAIAGDDGAPGREALAELMGSLAPNTIIVGIDSERQLLIGHQLVPSDDRDELDAGTGTGTADEQVGDRLGRAGDRRSSPALPSRCWPAWRTRWSRSSSPAGWP